MKHILVRTLQILREIYWFILKPKTSGVKVILKNNDQVLLIKNTYDKQLYLPGGGLKKNETPEKAAIREVLEETGIAIKRLHLIGKYTNTAEHKVDTIYLFYADDFYSRLKTKSPEIFSAAFYKTDDLPSNVSKATQKRLSLRSSDYEEGNW